ILGDAHRQLLQPVAMCCFGKGVFPMSLLKIISPPRRRLRTVKLPYGGLMPIHCMNTRKAQAASESSATLAAQIPTNHPKRASHRLALMLMPVASVIAFAGSHFAAKDV